MANLRLEPRASALIHDPTAFQHWVSIVGTAELIREGDEAAVEDAKVMARRYGDDAEQFTSTASRGDSCRFGSSSGATPDGRPVMRS